jgi:sec-independent protein translocase protein TatA
MIGSLGTPELILILVVVLLLFGVGRIGKLGSELGRGIRAFRQGMQEEQEKDAAPEEEQEEKETTA